MTDLVVVETSDLMLALGIKFWAGIIEKENIQDLEECHHLINLLQDFLLVKSLDDKEEVKVKFMEKPEDKEEYQSSPATQDGDDDDDDDDDEDESCGGTDKYTPRGLTPRKLQQKQISSYYDAVIVSSEQGNRSCPCIASF